MRPGEKIHEDLINDSESLRTRKIGKYLAVSPSYTMPFNEEKDYSMDSSKSLVTKQELRDYLESLFLPTISLQLKYNFK